MRLHRFEVPGLSHFSYSVESKGEAAIVDPKRDIDTYVDYAARHNLRITKILETHIHADYASGARELAQATGAELWVSAHDRGEDFVYGFPHNDLKDGAEVKIGAVRAVALHTPGHTPEHLSFLLHDEDRCPQPIALLSGDFLFVGSLGRPDLLGEGAKRKLAEQLYESLTTKIAGVPDGVEVHPAHGAGSMCGSGMSDRPQSTVGYERCANKFFAMGSRDKFIEQILGSVPPFPDYYRRMKKVNSAGPELLLGLPGQKPLAPADFRKAMETEKAVVIDLRRPEAFGGAHIPGAFNIGDNQNLPVWASWVVPYDQPILLAGDDSTDLDFARRSLVRVGLDNVRGWLKGGVRAWIEAGFEQEHVPQISVTELQERVRGGALVLDVRGDG